MAEKILIRGVNWIGDAVMTLPALKAIKKAYPDFKISLLVRPSVAPIFERNPDIDEIVLYEDIHRGIVGRLNLALKLRRKRFTRAILFQNAFDAALIAFLAGIPERIGYNRDGRGFLLTKPIHFNGEDRGLHHIDYYLHLLNSAGIKAEYSAPWIRLGMQERLNARDTLAVLKRPILGINPGAAYGSAKRWFPERFAEVAKWFIEDTGGSVVLFGSEKETPIAREIEFWFENMEDVKKLGQNLKYSEYRVKQLKQQFSSEGKDLTNDSFKNLAGRTTVRELAALISECDVFLSNDSGPMHIAYAVGAPLVALFGSTSPDLTGPMGNNNRVIRGNVLCSPCFERTCKGKTDILCMQTIASEDVYFAIKELLPAKKAVFFDRDGTLCRDAHYLNNWKDFEVFPEIDNLKVLKDKGFELIGISNQSGIQRGLVNESFAKEVNQVFIDKYGFDDFYYCPHSPDENCSCRKPEPGMLLKARAQHMINLKQSYVVGDKDDDMLIAKAVGAKGILTLTGQHKESSNADFTARDLKEAVDFIVRDEED